MKRPTICLTMIVKDEAAVIESCLRSVIPFIDHWVIVDTGSKDDTCDRIQKTLQSIPGNLYQRPWVNFAHNRSECIQLAQGTADYLLHIDADEELIVHSFQQELTCDYYLIPLHQAGCVVQRVFLFSNHLQWLWEGVLHEELVCYSKTPSKGVFEGAYILANCPDGCRTSDPDKFLKDAQLMEDEQRIDPFNTRRQLFIAQAYLCAGDYQKALVAFQKRIRLEGSAEECFWSMYQIGRLQEMLGFAAKEFLTSYQNAYLFRPSRREPLFHIARHYFETDQLLPAFFTAKEALLIPFPQDGTFVECAIYHTYTELLLGKIAAAMQRYELAIEYFEKVLAKTPLDEVVSTETQACLARTKLDLLRVL